MALARKIQNQLFNPHSDLRALPRTSLQIQGTIFVPEDGYEQKCIVLDLSPIGAGLKSTYSAAVGTRLILHVEGLGRYEGTIVRHNRVYVGVKFKNTEAKRARIAEAIAAYVEGVPLPSAASRINPRVGGFAFPYNFSLASGESSDCEIVDIALTGVAFRAAVRPPIGERLYFGKSAAVVMRHTADGFAVAFSQASEANRP